MAGAARARMFDGLAGSAALGALALVAVVAAAGAEAPRIALAAAIGLLGAFHVGLSVVRAWRGEARRALLVVGPVALAAPALVVAGGAAALEWTTTIAALVVPAHVMMQAVRIARFAALRAGTSPSRALGVAGMAGALASVLALWLGPRAPLLLRGAFVADGAAAAETMHRVVVIGVLGGLLVCAIAAVLAFPGAPTLDRRARASAVATVVVPAALLCAPLAIDGVVAVDWFFSGPVVVVHALQLLVLASFVEPRVARIADRPHDPVAHAGKAIVIGAIVCAAAPWLVARVADVDPTTAMLAATAALTLAHALVDVPTWSRADTQLVRVATQEIAPAPSGRADVSNARALAFTVAAAVVVAVALAEPAQAWLLRRNANDREIELARTLAPANARLRADRIAQKIGEGHLDEADVLLRADRRVFAPDLDRLRVHVCALRDRRSARCFEDAPPWLRDDVDTGAAHVERMVALGELASAAARAERLARTAPRDPVARATLGFVHARQGQLTQARTELAPLVEGKDALDLFASPRLVAPALAYAEVLAHDRRFAEAAALADVVVGAAADVSTAEVTMAALGVRARALDAAGDPRGALDVFQRALRVAPFVAADDASAAAEEARLWLDYGALLERSQATAGAAYVTLVAAERALARVTPTSAPGGAPNARDARVADLRAETARVRAQWEPAVPAGERADIEAHVDDNVAQALKLKYEPAPSEVEGSAPAPAPAPTPRP